MKLGWEKLDCQAAESRLVLGPGEPLKVIGCDCHDLIRRWSIKVLLKTQTHVHHLRSLLKCRLVLSDSAGLGRGLRLCISNKRPGSSVLLVQGPRFV